MPIAKVKCPKCGHEWIPKVEFPVQCPRCRVREPLGRAKKEERDVPSTQ